MWLSISRGDREETPVKFLKSAALSYVINGTKGASQRQAAYLAEMRVYSDMEVR